MPIQVICTGCQAKLKAPDTAAGKKTKCPKCQTIVGVPAAGGDSATASTSSANLGMMKKKPDQWFLQTPDGSQYGPVVRGELDQWFSEGRVSSDCQLLKEGSTQWQWAAEIYPALGKLSASEAGSSTVPLAAPTPERSPLAAASSLAPLTSAPASSPLTPLSSAGSFADPLSSAPLASGGLSPLGTAPISTATLPSYTSSPGLSPAGYGQPSSASNPYSTGSYGAYPQRTGLHPMVIVAGIFHIMAGVWNFVAFIVAVVFAFILLAGGGVAAALGAGAQEAETQGAAGMIAALGIVGSIVLFVLALLILAYSIFQISAAVGLFRRRRWAKVASFVFAGLGIFCMFFYLLGAIGLEPMSILALVFEVAYVTIIFVAMLLPDATRDFR